MNLGPQMADISLDNQRASFNTGAYAMVTPLKNQNFEKNVFLHVRKDQKKLSQNQIFMSIGPQMADIIVSN